MIRKIFKKLSQFQNRDEKLSAAKYYLQNLVIKSRSIGLYDLEIDGFADKIEQTLQDGGLDIHDPAVWENICRRHNGFNSFSLRDLGWIREPDRAKYIRTPRKIDSDSFNSLIKDLKTESRIIRNIKDARDEYDNGDREKAIKILIRDLTP